MRNPDKEKELAKTSDVILMALDITEPQQIRERGARSCRLRRCRCGS
jgi:hypothetical protein